jgi:TolB-like protein
MKNKYFFTVFFMTLATVVYTQDMNLDDAIREASMYFMGRIPDSSKIAITNFGSSSEEMSEYIIDDLTKYIVDSGKFIMVDRRYLENARSELNFSMTGEVSDDTAQRIGHFVGAQIVISGSIKPQGSIYRMQIRAIMVETAQIVGIETKNIRPRDINRLFAERIPEAEKEPLKIFTDERRYWSIGGRLGTPMVFPTVGYAGFFAGTLVGFGVMIMALGGFENWNWFKEFSPILTINANGTLAPFPNSFLELGLDMSLWNPNGVDGNDYMSLFPYAHYNFGLIEEDLAAYFGIGGGRMFTLIGNAERIDSYDTIHDVFALDLVVGLKLEGIFDLQGIFRYDFQRGYYFNVLVGTSYRFKGKS